ncbi:hypothetical protein [Staphylococcus epidermidis]|nr:hypothetical protein [Staphylococcus epidermidis]
MEYENDDLMGERYGDDYGMGWCVCAMKIGKEMELLGGGGKLGKGLV